MEAKTTIIENAVILLVGAIIVAPCLLTFTQGNNGMPSVWNLVGIAYTAALVKAIKFVAKNMK